MTKRSLILGVLLTSIALRAQDFASIRGLVTDSAGAAVTGAKVQVTEKKRGLSYSTATNETGEYELRGLLPGTYRLIVEGLSGFKKFESAGVVVYARESRRVDVPLEVGNITATTAPSLDRDVVVPSRLRGQNQSTQITTASYHVLAKRSSV